MFTIMANFKLILLFLGCIFYALIPVTHAKGTDPTMISKSKSFFCDAPAPNNFHVASMTGDMVNLAWSPVWPDAKHTLEILSEDSLGGWVNHLIYWSVPGSSYSVSGLPSGSYKARISTECGSSAERSIYTAEVEFKIIELTTNGRVPVNPVPADGCEGIVMSHNWVGFKVSKTDGGVSNFFEITSDGKVKRAYKPAVPYQIVAVDLNDAWPIDPLQPKIVFGKFRIMDLADFNPENYITVGEIIFSQIYENFVRICVEESVIIWKEEYSYQLFTASITGPNPPGGGTPGGGSGGSTSGQGFGKEPTGDLFRVANPFSDRLSIFVSPQLSPASSISIKLYDLSGNMLMARSLESNYSQFDIDAPTDLPAGLYLLRIETQNESHTIKVIKS